MALSDAEMQLSAQRLRELMLWHGKDEGNLPPAATLVNLSRDTVAALVELQQTRTQLTQVRAALSDLFWSCDVSSIRVAVLSALGAPPDSPAHSEELPAVSWEASPNGLPPHAYTPESSNGAAQRQWATG
jgi:hypothetical protein